MFVKNVIADSEILQRMLKNGDKIGNKCLISFGKVGEIIVKRIGRRANCSMDISSV